MRLASLGRAARWTLVVVGSVFLLGAAALAAVGRGLHVTLGSPDARTWWLMNAPVVLLVAALALPVAHAWAERQWRRPSDGRSR